MVKRACTAAFLSINLNSQYKGGFSFQAQERAEYISSVLPDKYCQNDFAVFFKAELGMRFKFYTWHKIGTIVVSLGSRNYSIVFVLLCSTIVNLLVLAAVSHWKPKASNNKNHSCTEWVARDLNHHKHYSSGPALLCSLGQEAMSSSPHTWDTQTKSLNSSSKDTLKCWK